MIYSDIKKTLVEMKHVSIAIDFWTSKCQDSYLNISASFINKKFEKQSMYLAANYFDERHNHQNISNCVTKFPDDLEIINKVFSITTDNADNVMLVADHMKLDLIKCVLHNVNLYLKYSFSISEFERIFSVCKNIVKTFKKSNLLADKLKSLQITKSPNTTPLKLLSFAKTRFNCY